MKYLRRTAVILGTIGLASANHAIAQQQPESGMSMPRSGMNDPIVNEGIIEDNAVDALKDMSNYLMTAKTLGIVSQGSLDVVTNDGSQLARPALDDYLVPGL